MVLRNFTNNYFLRHSIVRQFIKFCIIGGTSAIINFSIYYSTVEFFGLWYIYSAIISFIASAFFNFTANKFWTFRSGDKSIGVVGGQLTKYAVVMVLGLTINTSIIYGLTESFGLDYRISWVFSTGIVTFWNFGFNRFWTFKKAPSLS